MIRVHFLTRWLVLSTTVIACSPFSQLVAQDKGAAVAASSSPASVLSVERIAKVDAIVASHIDKKTIAGAAVLAVKDGKIVHKGVYGVRDAESGAKMTEDTIFRIYSMSKPITTVAAMMLWEDGKFKLDDPVSKLIPELKGLEVRSKSGKSEKANREMTIRDLMRHTSGLTYGFMGNSTAALYQKEKVMDYSRTLADMTKKLARVPLHHQPGSKFHYSISTDVLGRVVELASGKKLDVFFKERIFDPLKMKDTAFHVAKDKTNRFSANHGWGVGRKLRRTDNPEKSMYLIPKTFFSGGGGLVGTIGDYGRFCQMLVNEGELDGKRLLEKETIALMTKNHIPDEAMPIGVGDTRKGVGFGLGFSVRVGLDPKTPGRVGEYGWGGAASTHFWVSPADKLFVITMRQFMPYQWTLEAELKPVIYDFVGKSK